MASSSKPFSTVGKCEATGGRNCRKNGGAVREEEQHGSSNRQPMWTMLKVPTSPQEGTSRSSPPPPPRYQGSEVSGGYRVADAAYQTISSMLDETNELKNELKRCEAINTRQKLELQVKDLEIEDLRRRVSQLEEGQFEKSMSGIGRGSMKVLDDKLKYFELKVEEAEKEIEKMKKELMEEATKRRNVCDLLKDVYQAVIGLRLETGNILKQENLRSLSWLIDNGLEYRLGLLVEQLEVMEKPDFEFGSCHSQVMNELKTVKIIQAKLVQLTKVPGIPNQRNVSNVSPPTREPEVIQIEEEITITPLPVTVSSLPKTPKSPLTYEISEPVTIRVPSNSPPPHPQPSPKVKPVPRPVPAPGPRRMPNPSRTAFKKMVHKVDEAFSSQGFFCECGLQFRSKDHLHHHIKYFSCEKRFPCKFGCGKSFVGASILKKHLQVKHGVQIRGTMIGCRDCGTCFASRLELTKHRQQHHSEENDQPPTPLPSTRTPVQPAEPTVHVQKTPPPKKENAPPIQNPSSSVPQAEADPSGFADELIQMAGPTILHAADDTKRHLGAYCTCGQLCANRRALHHHLWYRNYKNRLMCSVCHRTYPGYSYLNRHMYGAHRLIPAPLPQVGGVQISGDLNPIGYIPLQRSRNPKRMPPTSLASQHLESRLHGVDPSKVDGGFHCLCGMEFSSNAGLSTHISTNHMITPNSSFRACHDCGEVFDSIWELLEHRKVAHEDEPQYPSTSQQENGKEEKHGLVEVIDLEPAASLSNLNAGPSSVPSSSPLLFYCKCGKGFLLKKNLMLHIRARGHQEKIFHCEWCPFRFGDHATLKLHIGKTHPHVNYTMNFGCNLCGGTFATRTQLYLHCRVTHRMSTSSSSS